MLFDDFPECQQSLVNGFGIGEHSGDIVVKFHEDSKIVKPVGIFTADAVAEVVFVAHVRFLVLGGCFLHHSFFVRGLLLFGYPISLFIPPNVWRWSLDF